MSNMQNKTIGFCLDWEQFEEYFLQDYTLKTIKKYKELYTDELSQVYINYWYGDSKNGKIQLFWTFSDNEEKIHNLSYNGSSPFAMFWVSQHEEDDEDEEEHCPYCHDKKYHTKLSPK